MVEHSGGVRIGLASPRKNEDCPVFNRVELSSVVRDNCSRCHIGGVRVGLTSPRKNEDCLYSIESKYIQMLETIKSFPLSH